MGKRPHVALARPERGDAIPPPIEMDGTLAGILWIGSKLMDHDEAIFTLKRKHA